MEGSAKVLKRLSADGQEEKVVATDSEAAGPQAKSSRPDHYHPDEALSSLADSITVMTLNPPSSSPISVA
jgi:hypothetical protein